MKLLLFIVLLITNTICADDCTSLSTENTCKEKTGCKWTAATCTGHNSCTSKIASETECTTTTYLEQLPCTYTAPVYGPGRCTGDTACEGVSNLNDDSACVATKFGGTACTYTAAVQATSATCTGHADCEAVTNLDDNSVCIGTTYGAEATPCTYTPAVAGTPASCSGNEVCTAVTALTDNTACIATKFGGTPCTYTPGDVTQQATCTGDAGSVCSSVTSLTSSTACESTTYDGTTSRKCVYAAGSCSAGETGKSDTNGTTNNPGDSSNTEQDNSGYIKFSLIFSLLYLLF